MTEEGLPSPEVTAEPLALAQIRDPERYLVLGEHGRGGLGRVSRAHDRELGRDVAIKELISRGSSTEARFLREALITARLEHPGIVPVHEAGRWPDGTPFYAMKLVSGRPLRELIVERKTAEERLGLLHHVIAVADAIAYAHGRHIVHRDLKPANVIVGEFGETVVIDWGLAKDLTASDEPEIGEGSPVASHDSELTVEGMVLGTPAYMAPEQARGEPVDERADVYAIGAMLWELCALRRVLPATAQRRRRMLRRAGIDQDLATIIIKALDPDPARRYPDAGALANDLKAFTSGARIAARHYTLFAMLAHWIRRHRALALTITVAVVVAAAVIVVFVRNIAIERDRADAARASADAARARADAALARVEAASGQLLLEHAELLLHTDPTAAFATLASYHGTEEVRHRRLVAEAEGRGVAKAVYAPHSAILWFLAGDRTGAIISLGGDRRIQLTHGGTSTTLASDVSASVRLAYAPSRHLLAYATSPVGIGLLEIETRATKRISTLDPRAMEFAPDGSRLAALDDHGELVVWSMAADLDPGVRTPAPGVIRFRFATPTRLILQDRAGVRALALDATAGASGSTALPGITALDAQPDGVVAGTSDGSIVVLSGSLAILGRTSMCKKPIRYVRFVPHTDEIAYSCQDSAAGVARLDAARRGLIVVDTWNTRGLTYIAPDATGRYVAVSDESGTAYIYDTETRLLTHYDGNAGQPSSVVPPTAEYDHVLIGDVNGTVRVWDAPTRAARVVWRDPAAVFGLAFAADGRSIVSGGTDKVVRRTDLSTGKTVELRGNAIFIFTLRAASDGSSMMGYGNDGTVCTWRASDSSLMWCVVDHTSGIQDARYIEHGRRIVSVGEDGRLLVRTPDQTAASVLFAHTSPLTGVDTLTRNDHVVITDAKGSIWDVSLDGAIRKVHDADGVAVTVLRASADGAYVATGTETGVVTVYDTASWHMVKTITSEGKIYRIQFDPKGRDLLVVSEASHTQSGHVELVTLGSQRKLPWRNIAAPVRDIAYAPDGETIGFVCSDGGTWLYSTRGDRWVYTRDHSTDTLIGRFSPDGRRFASSDRQGVVIVRDVESTFAAPAR
ncbi:MAG TPA: WD40 repeat domain-containing serine/threonine protein kinase [Kofleriaceae bacterium]|nr:WD40 repeat domain-containing serine/threonine protein kinase [Kofleriaceae bacterium]